MNNTDFVSTNTIQQHQYLLKDSISSVKVRLALGQSLAGFAHHTWGQLQDPRKKGKCS